jgi:RNA polymerase sigma-70 factor, ECF subfamily
VADKPASLASLTDQEVVLQARRGLERAYRELVRRYERPVFSLLYRMVRDRELAEDLSQETFVKALNAIESYRPEYKFSSWLFKIANNAAIDHLRRRELSTLSLEGSPHAATPEAMEATALQIGDRGETPLDIVVAKELGGDIEKAIAALRTRGRPGLRRNRRDPGSPSRHRKDLHPPGPQRVTSHLGTFAGVIGRTVSNIGPALKPKPHSQRRRRRYDSSDIAAPHRR